MILALALTLAAAPAAFPTEPRNTGPSVAVDLLGPPAVCHPFAIGDARSLPWKSDAFGFDPEFPLDKLNPELATLLDHQEDTLVQLESIRRAVVYAVGFGRTKELSLDKRKLHTEMLISMLRARVLDSVREGAGEEAQARAWFHLGYALAAVDQLDWDHDLGWHLGDGRDELKPALQWEGADAGMCLGAALAIWISEEDSIVRDRLLLKAARLAGEDGGLVTDNLVACGKRFYEQDDFASLVAFLEKRVAAS